MIVIRIKRPEDNLFHVLQVEGLVDALQIARVVHAKAEEVECPFTDSLENSVWNSSEKHELAKVFEREIGWDGDNVVLFDAELEDKDLDVLALRKVDASRVVFQP